MSRTRYRVYENQEPHFLTCTAVNWFPIFTRPEPVEIVLDSLRFLQREGRLVVYGYVIMVNHLHLVASAPDIAKEMGDFKSFTARRIIDLLRELNDRTFLWLLRSTKARHKTDRDYQLWQEGSHPQQILGEDMMRQKLEYLHGNPVKRGYVDDPLHWRCSSARNYEGLPALIEVVTDW